MIRGPARLHPAEAKRLVALSLAGLTGLFFGVLRANIGPSDELHPRSSCAQAAFRASGRIDCEAGEPLGPREALWMGVLLDLNTVDAATLQVVRGIGPALSERIVNDRRLRGPFSKLDDVVRVRGVGPRTLERMRPFVTVRPRSRHDPAARPPVRRGGCGTGASPGGPSGWLVHGHDDADRDADRHQNARHCDDDDDP